MPLQGPRLVRMCILAGAELTPWWPRVLEITGKDHLREVWPNPTLYMHGGVGFAPYRDTLRPHSQRGRVSWHALPGDVQRF